MRKCGGNNGFHWNILGSGEDTFCLNGVTNKHSYGFCCQKNPDWIFAAQIQRTQKINVLASVTNNNILRTYVFEEKLTAERYIHFLTREIVPALTVVFPNKVDSDIPTEILWFQQLLQHSHKNGLFQMHCSSLNFSQIRELVTIF